MTREENPLELRINTNLWVSAQGQSHESDAISTGHAGTDIATGLTTIYLGITQVYIVENLLCDWVYWVH
jgi:hypothetical protein